MSQVKVRKHYSDKNGKQTSLDQIDCIKIQEKQMPLNTMHQLSLRQKVNQQKNNFAEQTNKFAKQKNKFAGYLGIGSKRWSAIWQTLVFGLLILSLSVNLGFFIFYGTGLNFIYSLMISTFIASSIIGVLNFKLHGQYQLRQDGDYMLGELRQSDMQKTLILFCIGFVLLILVPSIGFLVNQNESSVQDVIWRYIYAYVIEIILGIAAHFYSNYHESNQNNQNQAINGAVNNINEQVVIPLIALLRDFLKSIINSIQAIIVTSFILGLIIWMAMIRKNTFSIEGQGFWNPSNNKVDFKFRHLTNNGSHPYNYWQIQDQQSNMMSKYFPNGRVVTQQSISQFLNAESYYTDARLPQPTMQYFSTNPHIWRTSKGRLIQLYEDQNRQYKNLVDVSNNFIEMNISMYKNTNGQVISCGMTDIDQYTGATICMSTELIYKKLPNNNLSVLYQFPLIQKLHYWIQWNMYVPISVSSRQYWWWNNTYSLGGMLYSFLVININTTQQQRYLNYRTYSGVSPAVISVKLNLTGVKDRYIDFQQNVFDTEQIKFMFKMNTSVLQSLSFLYIDPATNIVFNFVDLQFKTAQKSIIIHNAAYIDPANKSFLYTRTDEGHQGQILATHTQDFTKYWHRGNDYFQWARKVKLQNDLKTQTFIYIVDSKTMVNFWIKIYFYCIACVSVVTSFAHFLIKKFYLTQRISLNQNNNVVSQLYSWKHTLFHFLSTIIILVFGSIPLCTSISSDISSGLILTNLIASFFITFIIYYLSLKSWNPFTHINRYLVDLSILTNNYHKKQIIKTLQELGITHSHQLVRLLHQQLYKITFLNTFKVRQLLRQNPININNLKDQLQSLVRVQKANLNLPNNQKAIMNQIQETFELCFPTLSVIVFLLVYSMIAKINGIQNIIQREGIILGFTIPVGILSIIHFVWQHKNQIFQRNNNGQIQSRTTTTLDFIKIAVLAVLMILSFIGMLVLGFIVTEKKGINSSLRLFVSLATGAIGLIIAIIIHVIWNQTQGVLGLINLNKNLTEQKNNN